MNITFLVPCKDFAGGLRVVAAYGNSLIRRGHYVKVIYPKRKISWRDRIKLQSRRFILKEKDHLDNFRGELIQVPSLNEEYIPDGDCLIATAWQTAEIAKDYSKRCGKKFYLIQGYETWSGAKQLVDQTFEYPFNKIVISKWLKGIVQDICGEENIPVIPNGKDFLLSESLGDGLYRKYDIGMLYSTLHTKKSNDGLEAITKVKNHFSNLKVVLFGSEYPTYPLPDYIKFFRRPSQEQIKSIYLSTRVWLSTSVQEGFCLPALEAISLGCAVVATNSLGIEDIITHGKDGILVEPENPENLANKTIEVLENGELERKLQLGGLKKSYEFSWESSADKLESFLIQNQ